MSKDNIANRDFETKTVIHNCHSQVAPFKYFIYHAAIFDIVPEKRKVNGSGNTEKGNILNTQSMYDLYCHKSRYIIHVLICCLPTKTYQSITFIFPKQSYIDRCLMH